MDQEKRNLIVDEFRNAFQAVYEDDTKVNLDPELKVSTEYARIRSNGTRWVDLYIAWDKWENESPERQLAMLLHELSHVDQSNHKIEFWKVFTNNYFDVMESSHLFERDYDWEQVAREIIKDAHANNVDRRQTTVGVLRGKLEERLGVTYDDNYSRDKYESKFDDVEGVKAHFQSPERPLRLPDDVEYQYEFTTEELWDYFIDQRESYGKRAKYWYLEAPEVQEPEDHDGLYHAKSKKDEKLMRIWERVGNIITPRYSE